MTVAISSDKTQKQRKNLYVYGLSNRHFNYFQSSIIVHREVMQMPKIYLDVLIIVNFAVCFSVLGITAAITGTKIKGSRHLIGAVIGSFSSLSIVTSSIPLLILIKLTFWAFMILVTFCTLSLKKIIKYSFMTAFINIVVVAVAYIVWYITGAKRIYIINFTIYFDVSLLSLIFSVTLAYTMLSILDRLYLNRKLQENTYRFEITIADKTFLLTGICDTGNMLTDYANGRKVVVCKSKEMCKAFELDTEKDVRFRYLPYDTASGRAVMKAITPRCVKVTDSDGNSKALSVSVGVVESETDELAIFNPRILV